MTDQTNTAPVSEAYHECDSCDFYPGPHRCDSCGKMHSAPAYIWEDNPRKPRVWDAEDEAEWQLSRQENASHGK